MERLSELSDDDASMVVEFWRALVLEKHVSKSPFFLTAESCMLEAFRAHHDRVSPMSVGVSEYDEIMSIQDAIKDGN